VVGIHEQAVSDLEDLGGRRCGGMHERRGAAIGVLGAVVGIKAEQRLEAKDRLAGAGPLGLGVFGDLVAQPVDLDLVLGVAEVAPAG